MSFIAEIPTRVTLKRLTQGGLQIAEIDPPLELEPGNYQIEFDETGKPVFKRLRD
jgi:hypothetical protein